MTPDDEHRIAAQLARLMAVICVRNSRLEDLHAGRVPVSRTGDGSDVIVEDAEGNRIPWSEVSRIDDDEMRALMREIVDRLYTFHLRADHPTFPGRDRSLGRDDCELGRAEARPGSLGHTGGDARARVTRQLHPCPLIRRLPCRRRSSFWRPHMSDNTTHLLLPYIFAAQAQKHVTHNEALRLLDAMVQLAVLDRTRTAPPASPADGDRHIVASGASKLWAGWDLNVAYWVDGACLDRSGGHLRELDRLRLAGARRPGERVGRRLQPRE
jgi:hypothetical protein